MQSRTHGGLLALLATVAFATSFLFPGVRIGSVPISFPSLVALAFLPLAVGAYDRRRRRTITISMVLLMALTVLNAGLYGFDIRNVLYLLIPLTAIGAAALMERLVDQYGILRVQRWALWFCALNVAVMLAQAVNLLGINEHFSSIWMANIDFVAANENEREILALTLPIRPPGLFPTGIYVSTVIYIVCRGIFVYQKKSWPLLLALMAILISTNRTLGVIFVLYESVAFAHVMGLKRFALRASAVVVISVVTVLAASQIGVDLFLLKFLDEEVVELDVESNASVVERLKTLEMFMENAPRHAVTGGFSSSSLVDAEHVFDSELMLRVLQFGLVGVVSMAAIILLPRRGSISSSWAFLIFLCLMASLTTTLMTSVVYAMAIAFYKEAVVRAAEPRPLRHRGARGAKSAWTREQEQAVTSTAF